MQYRAILLCYTFDHVILLKGRTVGRLYFACIFCN